MIHFSESLHDMILNLCKRLKYDEYKCLGSFHRDIINKQYQQLSHTSQQKYIIPELYTFRMLSLFPKLHFLIIRVCDLGTLDDVLGMDIADLIFNEALRF